MLPGRQHRNANQTGNRIDQRVPGARHRVPVGGEENDEQGDVQRGRLVERLIEAVERREHPAEDAVHLAAHEAAAQGKGEKAGDRQDLREQQTGGVRVEPATRRAEEERNAVKEVDQPVGNDRPREKRDLLLPGEGDHGNLAAARAEPGGQAVAGEEERRQNEQPDKRARPGVGAGRFARQALPAFPSHRRRASETVKIPQSSIHCSTLAKPAVRTSSSSSAWLRRRITHGCPPRWLVSVRAIISICGCHG